MAAVAVSCVICLGEFIKPRHKIISLIELNSLQQLQPVQNLTVTHVTCHLGS
jgi:hypothetical protein